MPMRAVRTLCCLFLLLAVASGDRLGAAEKSPAKPTKKPAAFNHGSWPFQPPQRPEVPEVANKGWVINPIDAFILHALEEEGLAPSPQADKLTLLRRVTFDLTGLPPTLAEQQAFLQDGSPEAYQKVVERLLASPRYGERWAQHWLDLVRYAETDGFNQDAHRPDAYRYRDYVIQAFNDDLPYDRFIAQQLAGDELEPDNPQALVATGLNRLYPDEFNAADVKQRRQEILDDITDTTGLVFLGLTMGCAQCHDHKFDEILQADYYKLQAFFTPMLPRNDLVAATPEEKAAYQRELAGWEEATAEIRAEMNAIVTPQLEKIRKGSIAKFDPDVQAAILKPDAERTAIEKQLVFQAWHYLAPKEKEVTAKLPKEEKARYEELTKKLAEFDDLKPKPLPTLMGITDASREAPPTFRFAGGNFKKPLDEVQPGFPDFLGKIEPKIQPPSNLPETTGRRSELARWLGRVDHPLTARVMVNRVWQQHFGLGIVPSTNDFGAQGDAPSHPRLLDWLAVEFASRGWSFKQLHQLMVLSATYRQSSLVTPDDPRHAKAIEADSQNMLLWHARRRRLEGEALRDAMLQVSGEMNPRMFGPSAKPQLPKDLSNLAWKPDEKEEDQNRRSIYVLAKRNLRYPLFDAFDLPDMHHSCARRPTTITAPQALLLLNSEFSCDRARHWAGRLLADDSDDDAALVTRAYKLAFGRAPQTEEIAIAREFIHVQTAAAEARAPTADETVMPIPMPSGMKAARGRALVDFCQALLNTNEFLYLD
jgi:3',5'-cyclic AMP phosphodiesterase CpdA